ncbi:MAG: STAS domain-containing protein [SAR324 cluster bacterium]|nr:STAS domain-containing protein [SAR324 cluster bacterium]
MQINHEKENNALIFKLVGDMVWQTVHESAGYIMNVVEEEDYESIIINFEGVNFIDSTGIGLLIELYKVTRSRHMKLAVWGMSSESYENLVKVKLDHIFVNHKSKEDALSC